MEFDFETPTTTTTKKEDKSHRVNDSQVNTLNLKVGIFDAMKKQMAIIIITKTKY